MKLKRPWLFAAALPMSSPTDAGISNHGIVPEVSKIPLWIFQGALDGNPTPQRTESYINAFRKAGANVRYTLYPQLGHGTWNKAFAEPDFFSWMLGQNKASIHTFEGSEVICSDEGTRLELAEGFHGLVEVKLFQGLVVLLHGVCKPRQDPAVF